MAKKSKPVKKTKPAAKAAKAKPAKKPLKLKAAPKKAAKPAKALKSVAKPALKVKAKAGADKAAVKVEIKAKVPAGKDKKGQKLLKGKPVVETEVVEAVEVAEEVPEEIVLTDAEGRRYCRTRDCDQLALVDSYCRYHYLLFWKRIQVRKKILGEGKLERYVEELTSRYPDKFLEVLKKDLRTEKDFLAAIQELEIDDTAEEGEFEDEAQNYIEEVRGITESPTDRADDDSF